MRLDKYLAEANVGTRSQVKDLIRKKLVTVNGEVVNSPESQVKEGEDLITCQGKEISLCAFQYFLLNKPAGVISATKDRLSDTVLSLLPADRRKDLFPVGRLDKDTEGLLLITNDGALAHQLLSPKKHVAKTYLVHVRDPLSKESIHTLETGCNIGDEELTLPAQVTLIHDPDKKGNWIHLTITEGRFHQVKRMLEAVGNEVLYLKRIRFGALSLGLELKTGECRELSAEEVELLKSPGEVIKKKRAMLEGIDTIIFDLDGSLVDSMWIWTDIDEEYLSEHHLTTESRDTIKSKIEGKSFYETAVYFKEFFHIEDSLEKIMSDWNRMAWDKYEKEVPLKPGVPEFLEGCKKRGISLGIATSNSRELVDNVLGVHALKKYFGSIVTGSEVLKGKPAPDIYLKVARELHADPSKCLIFEDILRGIEAGKNAGMTTCAVADVDSADSWDAIKAGADYSIWDFYDFFER